MSSQPDCVGNMGSDMKVLYLPIVMVSLPRVVTTEFGRARSRGRFLAVLGFPGKSTGRPFCGCSRGANFPHGLVRRSSSSIGFPFRPPPWRTTAGLLLPSKSRPSRQRSAHRRIAGAISPVAYTLDLPTVGRRRASPVMSQNHFLQAAAHITRVVHRRRSVLSAMGGLRASPALHSRAVTGAPDRPQCRLRKSLCLAPSSRCLLRCTRWHRPGCVPPLEIAEFEQRVLNRHGPAQVGFGIIHTSFHCLTVWYAEFGPR